MGSLLFLHYAPSQMPPVYYIPVTGASGTSDFHVFIRNLEK
jgi:hypothetical protein